MRHIIDVNDEANKLIRVAADFFTDNTWNKLCQMYDNTNPRVMVQNIMGHIQEPTRSLPLKKHSVRQDNHLPTTLYKNYEEMRKDYWAIMTSLWLTEYSEYDNIILTFDKEELQTDDDTHTTMRILASKQKDIIQPLFEYELKRSLEDAQKQMDKDSEILIQAIMNTQYTWNRYRMIGILPRNFSLLHNTVAKLYKLIVDAPSRCHEANYVKISLINN